MNKLHKFFSSIENCQNVIYLSPIYIFTTHASHHTDTIMLSIGTFYVFNLDSIILSSMQAFSVSVEFRRKKNGEKIFLFIGKLLTNCLN